MLAESYLDFKTALQRSQWRSPELHPALQVLVLAAAHWHWRQTGAPAVLTHLLRSSSEQRTLYPDAPGRRSPHEFGRAADLRTIGLSDTQADQWARWINSAFDYHGSPGIKTALVHDVGGHGRHLHLQVGPSESIPSQQHSTQPPVV